MKFSTVTVETFGGLFAFLLFFGSGAPVKTLGGGQLPFCPQAAPDVRIGGEPVAASAKNTEQISELGGSGGMPLGKFFQNNAKCCKLGHFCHALGGGMAPPKA